MVYIEQAKGSRKTGEVRTYAKCCILRKTGEQCVFLPTTNKGVMGEEIARQWNGTC
jgi:hypothetical protein